MTQRDFDVWLHGFPHQAREAPPLALSRVFGIPMQAAEALVSTLPRVVKRDATAEQAERLVHALEAIGGHAEAVPTRVVSAPVLVVGTQPAAPRPETIVRHAPRAGAARPHAMLLESAGTSETLRLGTQEIEAFRLAALLPSPELEVAGRAASDRASDPPLAPRARPDATLVDPEPPKWSDLELANVHAAAAAAAAAVAAAPLVLAAAPAAAAEPRNHWDDLELQPPSESNPPISLAPPPGRFSRSLHGDASELELTRNAHEWIEKVGQAPIPLTPLSSRPPPAADTSWITLTPRPMGELSSNSPPTWKNPMALPPEGVPLRSLGMRLPSERARVARPRSQHPPSLIPGAAAPPAPSLGDAFGQLARGDFGGAVRASPTLAFALVLFGVTLVFAVAYAAM